eukprot:TRINITY_DN2204_c0_g1_i2.p2 TRINITY_DN2204_c0_g1~~TRINITY_DN2204_c0_g1_i2.p2  ORF type:complete len:153 (-),score=46.71 TRINITY_DN2204_c0_g1_i2:651-1109(-)
MATAIANNFNNNKFILNYINGNLFNSSESLGHCISSDCGMSKGIAIEFKKRFGGINELRSQINRIGQVAFLRRENRFIYYLITKEFYFNKPTYQSLENSLKHLREIMIVNNDKSISLPKIGCGLDKLEWPKVEKLIKEIFCNTNICITIYSL